ncbi:hypothetical protein HDU67_005897 [Dinochytrium kinnereticum]|nr:hypothetical protein HDU67_005897 [Dinochytrium kinnereticum]
MTYDLSNQARDRVKGYMGTSKENGWRTLFATICLFRFEVSMLLVSSLEQQQMLIKAITGTLEMSIHAIGRLGAIQLMKLITTTTIKCSKKTPSKSAFVKRMRTALSHFVKGRKQKGCLAICDIVRDGDKYHIFTKTLQCRLISRVAIMVTGLRDESMLRDSEMKIPLSYSEVKAELGRAGMKSEVIRLEMISGAGSPSWWK